MDGSKYKPDENATDTSVWMIDTFTNLDVTSLSAFQETTIEGILILGFLILMTQLTCIFK